MARQDFFMYLKTLDCGVLCSLASSPRKTSGSLTVERLHQVVPAPPNPDTKQTSAVLLISLSGAARRPCEKGLLSAEAIISCSNK